MQTGRRGRDRAGPFGEYGLVVRRIRGIPGAAVLDIGRQRHLSHEGDRGIERLARAIEDERHLAAILAGRLRAQGFRPVRIGEQQDFTLVQAFGRPDEGSPSVWSVAPMQRDLDPRGGVATASDAEQPGRNNARIVDHQGIAWSEQVWQVADDPVGEMRISPRSNAQQPGRIARACRTQRDRGVRQNEIKSVDAHAIIKKARSGRGSRAFPSESQPIVAVVMRSGSRTGSPRLILSTFSMPEITCPQTVYCLSRKRASSKQMKN